MRGYFSVVGILEQRFSSALSQISGLIGQKRSQGSSGRVGWLRVIAMLAPGPGHQAGSVSMSQVEGGGPWSEGQAGRVRLERII